MLIDRLCFEGVTSVDFCIEDTRKKPVPKLKEIIDEGIITPGDAADWLRTIYEIRFFEEKVFELLGTNIIKGASHLYAGEEAIAVGAIAAIEHGDVIGSTHRGHGHCGAIGNKYADTEDDRQNHWNRMMAAADVPPPMSEPLELASIPDIEKIVETVRSII